MSELHQKINNDFKEAFKSRTGFSVGVLRLLLSAIHNKEIEKRGKTGLAELNDEEVLQVLTSEAKKRKESIIMFEKGNRFDLAEGEKKELELIQKYLPKQLSKKEIEEAVNKILAQSGVKDFGSAMKELMKELKGKADAKLISEIVKEKLGTSS